MTQAEREMDCRERPYGEVGWGWCPRDADSGLMFCMRCNHQSGLVRNSCDKRNTQYAHKFCPKHVAPGGTAKAVDTRPT